MSLEKIFAAILEGDVNETVVQIEEGLAEGMSAQDVLNKGCIAAMGEVGHLVLIGGAPVTQAYADEIGADGFAPDASQAARLAKELIAA